MADFLISLRSPRDPRKMVAPRYLVIEDGAPAPVALPLRAWTSRVMAQFPVQHFENPARDVRAGDILFLVHGYNVDDRAALAWHRLCADSLRASGWNGLLISYDWPADGLVFAYLPDRFDARQAASLMIPSAIAVLQDRQAKDCTVNVHVLAHSMGGFVTQQAFLHAYQDVPTGWRTGQVLFVSADVDHTVFSDGTPTAKAFSDHAGRFTCYTNRRDKALLASSVKRLAMAPRVGRVGLPDDAPRMMVQVDCSALFDSLGPAVTGDLNPAVSHGFYFRQRAFWDDVVLTLSGGLDRTAYPRSRIADRDHPVANRFDLAPAPLPPADYAEALRQAISSQPTI